MDTWFPIEPRSNSPELMTTSSPNAGVQPRRGVFRKILCNDHGLRAGWRLVLYLALFVVMASLLGWLLLLPSGEVESEILRGPVVGFLELFASALVMAQIERGNPDKYGLPWQGAFGKLFWQGCGVGLIEVSFLVGVMAMVHSYSFGPLLADSRSLVKWGLTCVYLSVSKALCLQFMFRGYTQYTLAEGIGFWSAAEVWAATYAIFNVLSGKPDYVGLPVLFVVGLFWSMTLRRTRSLWFAVGLQGAFDFGATFLYSVPNLAFGFPLGYHLSKAALHGSAWLTGGTMGAEGSPLRFLTLGTLLLLANKLYPAKAKDALANNKIQVSTELEVTQPRKRYLRSRGWKDLIFVCVVLAFVFGVKLYFVTRSESEVSDFANWQARPKLDPVVMQTPGRRIEPCLFIIPPGASNQPVASGSIGECLTLVPDGRELNLYEVVLWSGNFIPIKTDLYVMDLMPLAFTRTHIVDSLARREHKYFRSVYEPHFYWDPKPYKSVQWYLPDGMSIKYDRNCSGPADEDPIWSQVHYDTNVPLPLFQGSRVNWTTSTWDLSLQDGTTYLLDGKRGSLVGIFDKNGDEIRLTRKPNGDLTEITSPNGNWIRFSQEKGLVSRAADSIGHSVNYIYDQRHRLKRVTDSRGEATGYEYNLFNHIDRIVDSKGSSVLEIGYAPHDRDNKVIQLLLPDGSKFCIDYFLDKETGAGHVEVTDPKGKIIRVTVNPKPGESDSLYTVEKLAHEQDR